MPNSTGASRPTAAQISVIIPVWRDSDALAALLPMLVSAPEIREVIVSAAGGSTGLARWVAEQGAVFVEGGAPNRGRQMDLGAGIAAGEWLLFHHADTTLTREHLAALAAVPAASEVVGGAFYRRFDARHPALRWLEPVERWHNRSFGALYGDQSIFVRRMQFDALGGFRALPLMEDVDFTLRLRRAGRVVLLDPPIASSPRKHLAQGPWRTTATNAALLALYHLGVSPARLHAWYYRHSASGGAVSSHDLAGDFPASPMPPPRMNTDLSPADESTQSNPPNR